MDLKGNIIARGDDTAKSLRTLADKLNELVLEVNIKVSLNKKCLGCVEDMEQAVKELSTLPRD